MVKRDHDSVRKDKMEEAVYNNNSRDLFAKVRKMNARKQSNPVSVDCMAGDEEISQLFSNKYGQLYIVYHMIRKYFRRLRERLMKEY